MIDPSDTDNPVPKAPVLENHMDKLLELVERCEKASGRDGAMDAAIAQALKTGYWVRREGEADYGVFGDSEWSSPQYTASLDAAISLVPEGWRLDIGNDDGCWAHVWKPVSGSDVYLGKAQSLPLALCAAALRARATPNPEE